MEDRIALVENKQLEVKRELEKWARENLHLQAGEQLIFTLSLAQYPIVVRRGPVDLLSMKLEEYFTKKRLRDAGIDPNYVLVRVYNSVLNAMREPDGKRKTIGDLVALGREKILSARNMGHKSLSVLETVLSRDGIKLSE